jgi:hypothetical protein
MNLSLKKENTNKGIADPIDPIAANFIGVVSNNSSEYLGSGRMFAISV